MRSQGQSGGRILVVDDDESVRVLLTRYLEMEGFQVDPVQDGGEALAAITATMPDLILFDLMLPVQDGLDILTGLRRDSDVPVILLTARGSEADRILGLELGADDYVVKPFSPGELVARVDAVLRRVDTVAEDEPPLRFGDLVIEPSAHRVEVDGDEVQLTIREYELLSFLARHPGRAFTRDELMNSVWQYAFYTDTSTVTVHIRRLRAKVERDPAQPRHIETVWGIGYRFAP